jgi:hypothetical protein
VIQSRIAARTGLKRWFHEALYLVSELHKRHPTTNLEHFEDSFKHGWLVTNVNYERSCSALLLPLSTTAMSPPSWQWMNTAFVQCGDPYSTSFVCPRGTSCKQIAQDYSATLCCPDGSSCSTVQPISCDASMLNATSSPYSQVHSLYTVDMTTCGEACCPPSYTCGEDGTCVEGSTQESAVAAARVDTQTATTSTSTTTHTQLRSAPTKLRKTGTTTTSTPDPSRQTYDSSTNPTNSSISNQHSQDQDSELNMITKALISVLAALLLIITIILLWRYFRRRGSNTGPAERLYHQAPYYKAELDGVPRRLRTPVAELNGTKTPGELSVGGSIYGARLPREMPAAYLSCLVRPRSLNSEKRELDAWSLNGWKTVKHEWD